MNKYLIIGDLEGRSIWKDIIAKENPDITIFLGDYVASRVEDIGPEDEISTLEELMDYKERNPQAVYLLRGNHDIEMLYSWGVCWPKTYPKVKEWGQNNKERFEKNTQWIYQIPDTNIICSHAGISKKFLENVHDHIRKYRILDYNTQYLLDHLNKIEPCELFGFTGDYFDSCGESPQQPCTWIRPATLSTCAIDDYTQVVGHTRIYKPYKYSENPEIWLCDALDYNRYLTIEDGKFESKIL